MSYVSIPRSALTMGREPLTIISGRLRIMVSMVSESLSSLSWALAVMADATKRLTKNNLFISIGYVKSLLLVSVELFPICSHMPKCLSLRE